MRILLSHGAQRNLGDIAMLEAVAQQLAVRLPDAAIVVVDRDFDSAVFSLPQVARHREFTYAIDAPDRWLRRLPWLGDKAPGIHAKATLFMLGRQADRRWSGQADGVPAALAAYVAGYDALLIAGGGFLTDIFYMPLQRMCSLIAAFAQQGKPVVLTGQQLGPFRWPYAQAALAATLRRAAFVGLRESTTSQDICRAAGLSPSGFAVMGDDSLLLAPATPASVHPLLQQHGCQPGRFLAFNYRLGFYTPQHAHHLEQACHILGELAHRLEMPVLVVPVDVSGGATGGATGGAGDDVQVGRRVQEAIADVEVHVLADRALTPGQVKAVLGQAYGALGASYHFCTFALSMGVPAVCLVAGPYYGQKAAGLCDFWQDARLALSLPGATVPSAATRIAQVLEDPGLRARLPAQADAAVARWEHIFTTHCIPALAPQGAGHAA